MRILATDHQAEMEAEVAKAFIKKGAVPAVADESNNERIRIADFSDFSNDLKIQNLLNLDLELVG